MNQLVNELQFLRGAVSQYSTSHPNLHLPQPPSFLGLPTELHTFEIKLSQFFLGNHNTYSDTSTQLLYVGSLLSGPASQLYESLVDPTTLLLLSTYTLDIFLQELEDFFGGCVAL